MRNLSNPLEKDIEKKSKGYARSHGWLAYKWSSPGQTGVPDDLFFRDSELLIVEFKRLGKKPTPKQAYIHEKLREQGFDVYVIDSYADFKKLLDSRDLGI